jgi:hypothetical protein
MKRYAAGEYIVIGLLSVPGSVRLSAACNELGTYSKWSHTAEVARIVWRGWIFSNVSPYIVHCRAEAEHWFSLHCTLGFPQSRILLWTVVVMERRDLRELAMGAECLSLAG